MADSTSIRRDNTEHVLQLLLDGKEHTAAQVCEMTGFSAATSNAILKSLVEDGKATASVRQTHSVGRRTWFYRLNEHYERVMVLSYEPAEKILHMMVMYEFGGFSGSKQVVFESFTKEAVLAAVTDLLEEVTGIHWVIIVLSEAETEIFEGELDLSWTIIREKEALRKCGGRKGFSFRLASLQGKLLGYFYYGGKCISGNAGDEDLRVRFGVKNAKEVLEKVLGLIDLAEVWIDSDLEDPEELRSQCLAAGVADVTLLSTGDMVRLGALNSIQWKSAKA